MFWKRLGSFIKTWALILLEVHQVFFVWKINGSTELPYTNIPYACFVGASIKYIGHIIPYAWFVLRRLVVCSLSIVKFWPFFDPYPPINWLSTSFMDGPLHMCENNQKKDHLHNRGTQNACLTLYTKSVQDNGNQKQHYTFLRALCCLFALYSYRFKRTLTHPRKS